MAVVDQPYETCCTATALEVGASARSFSGIPLGTSSFVRLLLRACDHRIRASLQRDRCQAWGGIRNHTASVTGFLRAETHGDCVTSEEAMQSEVFVLGA